ncbi:2-amino-5-chloromuconate deaminase CnbZ [Tautonia marina]|uniref:2-amino-5-chloromuconate deaminase CnbZ n=1 Tax=Tautonia marina TaxID=2653855 RepID=UPI0012610B0D|nr:RidA family protein [Tautonia marina]
MSLLNHPTGGYRVLPGIAPYSRGVVSAEGFEIVHVTLERPLPETEGFARIREHLAQEGRPVTAVCGIELRSPRPFSFDGFAAFNASYAAVLNEWGVFVGDVNPVARTNVAPEVEAPESPSFYGFSYTRACERSLPPTFVVAGAGELPEGILEESAIVRRGETDADAIAEKARFVMDLMEERLRGLGVGWDGVTAADVYTVHPAVELLPDVILKRMGAAAIHGVRWFYSRPPIVGIEYEMDVRGVRSEIRLG